MILEFVRELGHHFTHEQYLFWSRIQGTLWTLADLGIVFYLIRVTNLFRTYLDMRRHRGSYVLLAATVPFAVFVPIVESAKGFFYLELAVTIPHFLLILYLCISDAGNALRAISARSAIGPRPRPSHAE